MNDISKDKDYQEFFACTEVTFGTGEGLLVYGICARCAKQASVVRDAFSAAPDTRSSPLPRFPEHRKAAAAAELRTLQKIGLLHRQKADSGVWRQELLCGPGNSEVSRL